VLIISADCHAGATADGCKEYLPAGGGTTLTPGRGISSTRLPIWTRSMPTATGTAKSASPIWKRTEYRINLAQQPDVARHGSGLTPG
jgi:hypothetical protein